MATKRPGEKYWGEELHVPLSADGQVAAYVWPLRMLTIRGEGCGGPTIGLDVGNEEIVRFDCHDSRGHWHAGGYDRLGSPGNSQRPFPEGLQTASAQVVWALKQIQETCKRLLEDAEHGAAAQTLEPALVQSAVRAIESHLLKEGDLRSKAIEENLISCGDSATQ